LKEEHYQQAIDDFTTVIPLDPSYSEPYFHRGQAYLGLSNHEKAEEDFRLAEELSGTYMSQFALESENVSRPAP